MSILYLYRVLHIGYRVKKKKGTRKKDRENKSNNFFT